MNLKSFKIKDAFHRAVNKPYPKALANLTNNLSASHIQTDASCFINRLKLSRSRIDNVYLSALLCWSSFLKNVSF